MLRGWEPVSECCRDGGLLRWQDDGGQRTVVDACNGFSHISLQIFLRETAKNNLHLLLPPLLSL